MKTGFSAEALRAGINIQKKRLKKLSFRLKVAPNIIRMGVFHIWKITLSVTASSTRNTTPLPRIRSASSYSFLPIRIAA